MSLLVDNYHVVQSWEDLNWNHENHGSLVTRHLLTLPLSQKKGWADVIIAVEEKDGVVYYLSRWRKRGGAWHHQHHMRLRPVALDALITAAFEFVPETEERREVSKDWKVTPPPPFSLEGEG